jgi:hypothetical protein
MGEGAGRMESPHDGADGIPCTLAADHLGDHENFYAQRSWPNTCHHIVATNLRCDACGAFLGVR